MRDEQLFIACQAVIKELIKSATSQQAGIGSNAWKNTIDVGFEYCMDLIEKRAVLPEDEEWLNTQIPITKEFWNQTPQIQTQWLTEWGKPMPVVNKVGRKEWFVWVQKKNEQKLKAVFDKREDEFSDMVKVQEKKKEEVKQ